MSGDDPHARQALAHDATIAAAPGAITEARDDGDCLDERTAYALAAGSLPGEQRALATAHLDSCASCRELVATAALAGADDAPGYRVGAELARGGMGRVVLAEDLRLGREVVIKQLLDDSPSLRRRFEREVRITARLQHPGIVPVYQAGTLANGEPFYAMRRILGRSLDKVIAEATTTTARLALVPRFLVAAQAVAYAHAQRVIHRDLKPANILVGDFGEVIVVDWGLAKRLDGDDDEPDVDLAAAPAPVGDGALTRAGTVLGTPAYMAPEQASGEPADVRSDVYALGAVLYHLLAGAPPHAGATFTLTLVDVIDGNIEPLARRAPEVPSDLAAIVTRAMAREPAARYPDAAALAADVQTFLAGKLVAAHAYSLGELLRRWLRRHRAAVLATVAVVVGLGVVAAVAFRRVSAERDRARTQQAASESLVGFVLDDLRPRVRDLHKLALLEGVSREVDRYYQALTRSGASIDASGLARWGTAALVLGDVAFESGDLDASQAHYQRARDHLEAAERATLVPARPRRSLAIVHERLGTNAFTQDRLEDAAGEYERSLALHRGLPDPDPDEVGLVLLRMGRVAQSRGEQDRAIDHFRQARDWLRRFPDDPRAEEQLVTATSTLATATSMAGQLAEAAALRGEYLALAEARARAAPDDLARRFDLADARSAVGLSAAAHGDTEAARDAHRGSVDVLRELVAFDPDNKIWRARLATEEGLVGSKEYDLERYDAARAAFQRSLALWIELHRQSPDNLGWRAALALAHYRDGLVESAADRLPAASAAFGRAIALIRELAGERPLIADDLCDYLEAQAQASLQAGAHAEALAAVDEAVAISRRWYLADSSPRWLSKEATLMVARAGITRAGGDRAQAVVALRAARDLYLRYQAVATLRPWQREELAQVEAELAVLDRPRRRP